VPETADAPLIALLADEPLAGGLEPRLGATTSAAYRGWIPDATHPGILDELNRLAFPYRWSTTAQHCSDKTKR